MKSTPCLHSKSNKTINRNKPVEQTTLQKEPRTRQITKGHRFSIKKTSVVHEKIMTPRSCLRWKPTGKIFKTVGLRWVPTGKIFTSSTTKVDSEPTNGSKEDTTNQYECEQTLNVSAGTLNLSAAQNSEFTTTTMNLPVKAFQKCVPPAGQDIYITTRHSRTKHIHTRYHFIKEQVENGIIELYFVRTEYQLADMFTKALSEDRFQYLVRRIGMRCLTPAELEVLTNESA
ncbi:hypothetical protein Tco_0845939 [Tanacetum coccineum]